MVRAFCRPHAYTLNEQSKMATALTPQTDVTSEKVPFSVHWVCGQLANKLDSKIQWQRIQCVSVKSRFLSSTVSLPFNKNKSWPNTSNSLWHGNT